MIITTPGIVLHSTKYSDTSLIAKIYTEAQGTQSFIVKGAFGKKSRIKAALFSPMAMVSITYNDHGGDKLKYLKDIVRRSTTADMGFDPVKSSILLFYNELVYKLLFDAGPDTVLFHFLEDEILKIAEAETCSADTPMRFLIRLSIVLGFFPENNYSESTPYFSLTEGRFQQWRLDEQSELPEAESRYLAHLLREEETPIPDRQTRNNLLRYLIEYYKTHNEHLSNMESIAVLADILHA